MMCAIICMGFSATYHLLKCQDQHVCSFWSKVDYAGIAILILGSCVCPDYYYYACGEAICKFRELTGTDWRNIYFTLMTTLTALTFFLLLSPYFDQNHLKPLRAVTFIALGVCAALTLVHARYFPDDENFPIVDMTPWAIGGAFYVGGAIIYAAKIPERYVPGVFCIFVSIHG